MKDKESSLKLTAGLEIHQQLDTHKLFCNCPSVIVDDKRKPDLIVKRELRTQAGEEGSIDKAASFEVSKKKTYEYHFYGESCCLVELDEEPPHEINQEALKISLQFSKMINARINSAIQVMRKTVVDGSNTSGFQRTALVAMNGSIDIKGKKVRIPTLCLEEDAAKIVEKKDNKTIYNLSRLGIPLIEVATAPDLHSPEEVEETAEKIGLLLRSLNVKRGLGTIRQDVNVSIKGGSRVEIKGAQDLKSLKKIVEIEAERQRILLEIKEGLIKRGFKEIKPKVKDLTGLLENTESKLIKNSTSRGNSVLGFKVSKFSKLIGKEIMPNKRFGTELAMHAKLFGLKGLLHSDELPNYGITEKEVENIKKELGCKEQDAFILITGEKDKVMKAINNIVKRINYCIVGIPQEVRKAEKDNTTSFLRPMPGAARMYPETDIHLIKPNKNIRVPDTLFEIEKRYIKGGLNKELSHIIVLSKDKETFEKLHRKYKNVSMKTVAKLIFLTLKDLKRRLKLNTDKIKVEDLEEVIKALNDKRITEEGAEKSLEEYLKGKDLKEAINENRTLNQEEVRKEVKRLIEENKSVKNPKAIIGRVMGKLRGKAEGKLIIQIIKEELQQDL